MRLLSTTLILLSVGCATVPGSRQVRTLSLLMGSPRAVCDGGEKIVRLDHTLTISRQLGEGGEGCTLDLQWEGAILDAGKLGLERFGGEPATFSRLALRFERLALTDEVGQAIDAPLPELSLSLAMGEVEVHGFSVKGSKGPWGQAQVVELPAALRAMAAERLRRHLPVVAKVRLRVALDLAAQKKLREASRGPLFELRYEVEAELTKVATPTPASPPSSKPASQPASQPAPGA